MTLAVLGCLVPAVGSAEPKSLLSSFGTPNGTEGGQLIQSKGVAVNRSGNGAPAGSVYVAEAAGNHRISQFTASGIFVRTWGYDVIDEVNNPGAPNDNGTGFEICDVTNGNTPGQCKAGTNGNAAGQLGNPTGIAIDQSNGYLYISSTNNRRIDVFSGSGQFAGAFGWGVDTGAAALEVCTTASGCQAAAAAGGQAGNFGNLAGSAPGVDPNVAGKVYVPDKGNLRVAQYSTTIAGGELTAAAFDKAFGWDVILGGAEGLESCTTVTTCQAGQTTSGGNNPGQFTTGGSPTVVDLDSTGAIYVTSGPLEFAGTCSATSPCRIQKFTPDASSATDFGPSSGEGQLTFTAGAARDVAALNLAVDHSNDHVFVMRRATSTTYQVLEYDSSGNHVETHPTAGTLAASSANPSNTGLAVGTQDRVYTNSSAGGAGEVFILGPVPDATPENVAVTHVGATTATFTGTVTIPDPGAPTFTTRYRFEYSKNGVDWVKIPVPDANVGDGTTGVHAVSQAVTGLDPATIYSVRLVAITGPSATSGTVSFVTDAAGPRVELAFTDEVTQTDARLGAHIDPEGLDTSYHFEWGPTASYGNRVPAFERQIGSANDVVIAGEAIDGLESQSTYHYRVVATNFCHPVDSDDTIPSTVPCVTEGPDQRFETLNSCGLTDGRCYEMVSPHDKGPTGAGGDVVALGQQLQFQAASDRPAIEYVMAYGTADATAGEEVAYKAVRGPDGWSSSQLSAPAVIAGNNHDESSVTSRELGFSSDLSCGVFSSVQPVGDNPPTEALEAGGSVLYRRNAIGDPTLVTAIAPTNSVPVNSRLEYELIGVSEAAPFGECERVVFRTRFLYPGIPGAGEERLYRWEGGVLEAVGVIPGPGGPEIAEAGPGDSTGSGFGSPAALPALRNYWNAVSRDGSRIFFTAVSRVGGDAGRMAVFLSEDGAIGVDLSQSQTEALSGGTANDDNSVYQTASTDGSRVFFTGRYGLASNDEGVAVHSSAGPSSCTDNTGAGCDLYEYSLADGKLTDLSADTTGENVDGAGVAGVLGASDDGSHVYFAARGRLVADRGPSEAQNLAADTYSIYLAAGGSIRYVGRSGSGNWLLMKEMATGRWTSRVTPSGRHLLFETAENLTGFDSQGFNQAYLYSAETDETVCVSCRRDGGSPSPWDSLVPVLSGGADVSNSNSPTRQISDDGSRVFFASFDRLAVGATQGQGNIYQWENGQISFLTTSGPSSSIRGGLRYAGASRSGDDVYFTTVDQLTWEDTDGKMDVYDARVGGGFAPPPAEPTPCDPLVEGSCTGSGGSREGSDVETIVPGRGEPGLPPRVAFSVKRLSKRQLAALRAGRKVRVSVRVNRAGKVSVRGTAAIGGLRARVISASRRATGAGTVAIPVRLSSAARRRLARTGSLRIALRVRFAGARSGVTRLELKSKKRPPRRANTIRRAGK